MDILQVYVLIKTSIFLLLTCEGTPVLTITISWTEENNSISYQLQLPQDGSNTSEYHTVWVVWNYENSFQNLHRKHHSLIPTGNQPERGDGATTFARNFIEEYKASTKKPAKPASQNVSESEEWHSRQVPPSSTANSSSWMARTTTGICKWNSA